MFSTMENSQDLALGSMTMHINWTVMLILKDVMVASIRWHAQKYAWKSA